MTVLATPYLMSYDLVVFGWVLLALSAGEQGNRFSEDRYARGLLTAVYWLPMLTLVLGMAGIPGAALVLVAAGAWLAAGLAGRGESHGAPSRPRDAAKNESRSGRTPRLSTQC
jgi:hypothetical protein